MILAGFLVLPLRAEESIRTITVSGRGEVTVSPDMATVSLGVETVATTAREAMEANSVSMARIIDAIRGHGIEARDIQTSSLSLNPRWEQIRNPSNDAPRIIGYTASNGVTIRVRDLEKVGLVLDAVTRIGANRIHSISFGLQDNSEPMDKARVLAVREAMRKAALYAQAAEVTLGGVVSIEESVSVPRFQGLGGVVRMELAQSVPVEAGELSLSALVRIVVQIE